MSHHAPSSNRRTKKKYTHMNVHHTAHAVLVLALRPGVKKVASNQSAHALQVSRHQSALPKIVPLAVGTNLLVAARPASRCLWACHSSAGRCVWMADTGHLGGRGRGGSTICCVVRPDPRYKKKNIGMPHHPSVVRINCITRRSSDAAGYQRPTHIQWPPSNESHHDAPVSWLIVLAGARWRSGAEWVGR